MTKRIAIAFLALLLLLPASSVEGNAKPTLTVYTYGSFVSYGPAAQLKEGFEALYDVEVVFVAPASTGEMLGRLVLELETGYTDADVFVGLADTLVPRAIKSNVFQPYDPTLIPNLQDVPQELKFDQSGLTVPHNYGYVTLLYHPDYIGDLKIPETLEELTHPRYRGKIIVQDARSATGQGFLMWTIAEYGEDGFLDYWRRLTPNLLTITGGWSAAYQMFENGEAPIVVSYATDRVAAVVYGSEPVHEVLMPAGQGYRQIEVAGIVRTSDNVELAHAFIDYILSPEAQAIIALGNVAFPANAKAPWPDVFVEHAVIPENPVFLDPALIDEHIDSWLRQWLQVITQ